MTPFLAMIIPVGGGQGGGGNPPGIWGGANEPFPGWGLPPAGPGKPPGTWGGSGEPFPGYGLPTPRPPGVPTHPIYYPPGIWGGGGGNAPMPTPPIYIPPEGSPPPLGIWGPPDMPPGFWGGSSPGVKPQPHPEHPIVLPPDLPPETPEGGKIEWKTAWTPQTGWVVVGIPQEPHPTPSK